MISEAILEYGTVGAFHCKDIFDLKGTCKPEDVHTFECQVDTTESTISFVGDRFPNLRKLKLNNSIIPNIRDISCRFTNLRFLSLARCGITSLNGISTISKVLEELYLAFNQIDDCSELVGMDSLIVIDLEENNISDLSNIEFLSTCSNLQSLTLAGNPCVDDPESYRTKVRDLLPKLRYLDERRLQPKEAKPNPRMSRIRNEITYKKMIPKEPEADKSQSKASTTEKNQTNLPKEDQQKSNENTPTLSKTENNQSNSKSNSQSNQSENSKEKSQPGESETDKNQSKSKSKSQSNKVEKVKEKVNIKEPDQEIKNQSNPKNKTQSKQSEKVQQNPNEKIKSIEQKEQTENAQSNKKSKTQSKQSDKNSKRANEKIQPKEPTTEKVSSKTKEKIQNTNKANEEPQSNESQKSKSSKKVQIMEPPNPSQNSTSFQVTEPPNPPQTSARVKEPQYENDDEVIITDMLDDLIEDRPPTARGNYESKFFKDSFELKQRNKTPIALKTKPHVITPRVHRNRKPRAVSSIKKLD